MSTAPRLRGGIIGCGFFAQFHLDAWHRMPDVDVAAAADPDLDRARQAAPRAYSSAEEMLDREPLDFVDIATRPEWHLPLVRLAASRMRAVICQKPLAPSWQESVELVETAEAAGIPLMIHENWRWQPWYREARRILGQGRLGRPIGYGVRVRRRDGLGTAPYAHQPYFAMMPRLLIYETLVHPIDTARFLFGDLASVYAQSRRLNPAIKGEDQALLILTHVSGLLGAIDGNRYHDPAVEGPGLGDTRIEGEDAALEIHNSGDLSIGGSIVWKNEVTAGYRGDSVHATQRHFIDCLRAGASFETGGREYLQTVRAVEAAYESVAHARAIVVN